MRSVNSANFPLINDHRNVGISSSVTGTQEKWGFAEFFVISQTALPALLYLPGSQILRVPIRISAFAISLLALGWWLINRRRTPQPYPARLLLSLAMIWTALMILHPTTNSLVSGGAHAMLYLAVVSPIFWAPLVVRSPRQLKRLLIILFSCNAINSMVGVLQVYDPKTWMPSSISYTFETDVFRGLHLTYTSASGAIVFRPPGLFDTPGAVWAAGMIAALLGFIFLLSRFVLWVRFLAGAMALAGVIAVYLSHVRSAFVVMLGMVVVYMVVLIFVQKQVKRGLAFIGLATLFLSLAFTFSITLGGKETAERVLSLISYDPVKEYDKQRGRMVTYALWEQLPQYPIGAGLGRWGTIRYYFADLTNRTSSEVFAEIQIPAWIIDGGLPLLVLYVMALVASTLYQLQIAKKAKDTDLRFCAAIIVAVNLGVSLMIFSYVLFCTQIGMQYWFLAGALHGVWQTQQCEQR